MKQFDFSKRFNGTRLNQVCKTSIEQFSATDGSGLFSGYAAVYGKIPYTWGPRGGTYLQKGAFNKTVSEINSSANNKVVILDQHNGHEPVGLALVKTDSKGLKFDGDINLERDELTNAVINPGAAILYSNIKKQIIYQMSVGFEVLQHKYDEKKETRTITEARLFEISPVTFAANPKAQITKFLAETFNQFPADENIDKDELFAMLDEIYQEHTGESLAEPDKSTSSGADKDPETKHLNSSSLILTLNSAMVAAGVIPKR